MDDAAKLQKETEYKQQKMIVRKLIKKSNMQHYHEALKNARTNPKDTWHNLRQLVPGKSMQNKCNFQNPTISASMHLQQLFCNSRGENVQRRETEELDQWQGMREHIYGLRESPRCKVSNP